MIKTFKHKGLEKFFYQGITKGIQSKHAEKLADILDLLHAADKIEVMNFPGSRLHKLELKNREYWVYSGFGNTLI